MTALLCVSMPAQSKAELKAEKKAAKQAERIYLDSLLNARKEKEQRIKMEEKLKRNSNVILVLTTYETKEEAFDYLIGLLYQDGYMIKDKDKEYGIIRTEATNAGLARYGLNFRVFERAGNVYVDISGLVYTSFTIYGVHHENADPIVNKGVEGSALREGFYEMERYAYSLPCTNIQYLQR